MNINFLIPRIYLGENSFYNFFVLITQNGIPIAVIPFKDEDDANKVKKSINIVTSQSAFVRTSEEIKNYLAEYKLQEEHI